MTPVTSLGTPYRDSLGNPWAIPRDSLGIPQYRGRGKDRGRVLKAFTSPLLVRLSKGLTKTKIVQLLNARAARRLDLAS